MTNLLDLPDELLLRILSHLTPYELCRSASGVCSRLRALTHDTSLWLELDFKDMRRRHNVCVTEHQNLRALASRCTALRVLTLDQASEGVLSTFIASCRSLKVLRATYSDISETILISALQRYQLEELDVEGNERIEDGLFTSDRINPSRFASIARLNLAHCRMLSDATIFVITEHCVGLREINLDGVRYATSASLRHFIRTRGHSLTSLTIDGADIDDSVPAALGESATNLKTFSSSFCEAWSDASLESFKALTQLESLRLRKGFEFSREGLVDFFAAGSLRNLTKLDLTECAQLTDPAVQHIAVFCPRLKFLNLSWCWLVGDIGVTDIVASCSELLVLDLTGLKSLSGKSLTGIVEKLPFLKVLNLKQCNYVSDSVLMHIARERKDMIVVDYYGQAVDQPETEFGYFGHVVLDDGTVVSLG